MGRNSIKIKHGHAPDIAKAVGVSTVSIWGWKTYKKIPGWDSAIAFVTALENHQKGTGQQYLKHFFPGLEFDMSDRATPKAFSKCIWAAVEQINGSKIWPSQCYVSKRLRENVGHKIFYSWTSGQRQPRITTVKAAYEGIHSLDESAAIAFLENMSGFKIKTMTIPEHLQKRAASIDPEKAENTLLVYGWEKEPSIGLLQKFCKGDRHVYLAMDGDARSIQFLYTAVEVFAHVEGLKPEDAVYLLSGVHRLAPEHKALLDRLEDEYLQAKAEIRRLSPFAVGDKVKILNKGEWRQVNGVNTASGHEKFIYLVEGDRCWYDAAFLSAED